MVVQDVLGVIMVQAEARNRGWLAGLLDMIAWLVAFVTLNISLNAVNGHDTTEKWLVIILVSAANLFGTKLGQMIGAKYVTDATTLAERVARLEALNPHIHTKE
jgi:hypothetical protein